jgi:DNA-3-methyladenine glycosylase II
MRVRRFALTPTPPFRLDLTVWTLRRRPDNLMDRWDGQTYRRVLAWEEDVVELATTQEGSADDPHLHVTLSGARLVPTMEEAVRAILTRMLGLSVDLAGFYHMAEADVQLAPLVRRFRGVKPPRFPSLFEALINAIACQQITLTQGIHLLNRLTQTFGLAATDSPAAAHAFPRAHDLANRTPDEFKPFGFSGQKGRAIVELAGMIAGQQLDLEALAELDEATILTRLLALRGVGRWSAEYVLLRGLGRLDRFPGDDVGARNNLHRWLGLTGSLDYAGVQAVIAPWHPYGGLVYFHLLLDRLAEAGYLR